MRSNSRRGVVSARKGSFPKIRSAIRPLVDSLERRLLLSGTLPSFVQASTDANYTLDNSSGLMVMDLNSGSLVVNADLSTATGWSNATVRLHNSAHIYFNSAQTLGDLELHNFSRAAVALGNTTTLGNMLKLSGLAIDSYAAVDLGDNAMILHYIPSQEAAEKSLVSGLLTRGYANGYWTGTGINSSAAANDPSHNTALGWFDQYEVGVNSINGDSADVADGYEMVVKYTVYGDADLSGKIDATDSSQYSLGLHGGGSGWGFGDFNYDGNIDQTDGTILNTNALAKLSLTNAQYVPALQVQPLSFTAYEYTPWSGDVATFTDSASRVSYSVSDYSATINWGGFVEDAQITQPTAGADYFRVNAQTSDLSNGPFTIQISYAAGGTYTGAPTNAVGMITALQLPSGAISTSDAVYTLSGSPGAISLNVTAGTIAFNTNVANAGNYWQNLTINASGNTHLIFNSAQTLDALNLSGSAVVTVSQGSSGASGNVLQLDSLSAGAAATLDLGDNSMILEYAPGAESSAASLVQSLLASGYNNGAWNGPGIDSSSAANDAAQSVSVGWMDNNVGWIDSNNTVQHDTSFANVSLADFDQILVRSTLAGDANLDGVVDGTDLQQTSRGQSSLGTGWQYGDFNYNATAGDQGDFSIVSQNSGKAIAGSQYAPAFQLSLLTVQPYWNSPYIGDVATFSDTLNHNLPAGDYTADIYWGIGDLTVAQVYSTNTPGQFRINTYSPVLTGANSIMMVTVQYADGSGQQGEPAIATEPIYVLQLPPGVNGSADAVYSVGGLPGQVGLSLTAGSLTFDTNVSQSDGNYWKNLSLYVSGSAHAYFNAPEDFSYLQMVDNATVTVSRGSGGTAGNLLNVQQLSIDPGATLDLSDNGLIDWYAFGVDPSSSSGATVESEAAAQMSDWLRSGYNGGAWNGTGIISSVAANDTTHATTVGWMDNGFNYAAIGAGPVDPSVSSFHGVSLPTKDQLLVDFTFKGDANLNGQVDTTDDSLLNIGLSHQGSGWVYGDFNYDSSINSADSNIWQANYGLSANMANVPRAFQPTGIIINPVEGVPLSQDIATFTDLLNPSNTDPSIYQAMVNWGDSGFGAAQVTATSMPGSFRINALSPALTDPNAVITVTIQYADMNDPSPTYQGRPAAVSEPVNMIPAIDDLVANPVSGNEIDLTWNVNAGTLTAVNILSSSDGGQTWNIIATVTSGNTYQDTSVSEGTSYQYQVQATEGSVTGPVSSTTASAYAIASPSDLVATPASDTEIDLSWNNPSSAASQTSIYVSSDGSNFDDLADVPASQTSYQATGLDPRTTYTFYVVNSFAGQDSAPSASASAKPNSVPTPTGLSASATSTSQINLSWAAALNVAGFNIYRSTLPIVAADPNDLLDFDLTSTSYQDTGLDSSTTYYYLVTAVNAQGDESDASTPASATTPAGQITATGSDLTGPEGTDISGTIATFTDTQVNTAADDYTASIDWGDGDTSAGTIQMNDSGGFDVDASHAYQSIGDQTATVTITHTDSGRTATATGTVHLEDPGITIEADQIPDWDHKFTSINETLATFTSADSNLGASDFSAQIDWGDGTGPTQGVIQPNGSKFNVYGNHVFNNSGLDVITVTVTDSYGAEATAATSLLAGPFGILYTNTAFYPVGNGPIVAGVNGPGTLEVPFEPYYGYGHMYSNWGVADSISSVTGYEAQGGSMSQQADVNFPSPSTATIQEKIGSTFSIEEGVEQSSNPSVYMLSFSIQNISSNAADLLYRAPVPFDGAWVSSYSYGIPPDQFSGSSSAAQLEYDASSSPIDPLTPFIAPSVDAPSGSPMLECDFGTLQPRATQTFTLFYGMPDTEDDGAADLQQLGADLVATNPGLSTPMVFGFKSGPQYTADLQVDSNNDGTINSADDTIKDDPSKPGKVIVANTLDDNGYNFPGYNDSMVGDYPGLHNLAEMNLVTSDNFDSAKATVTFHYSEADPADVNHTMVANSPIDHYDPGSTGALRIWDAFGRKKTSFAQGGDLIPDGVAMPWSAVAAGFYIEGVNPTDPNSTEITVDIDDGSGHIIHDAVRVTVASLQIVYTDVSGITHSQPDGGILNVSRIAPDTQPDGVACDWMNGVDDGSSLLISVVGSPALQTLYNASPNAFSFQFGQDDTTSYQQFSSMPAKDGYFHSLNDGFVPNATQALTSLGIPLPGETCLVTGLQNFTVLGEEFYRPPNEYGDSATIERRISPAIRVLLGGTELAQGAKPQGLLLTRPPLVLVHGMNSSPAVWYDDSQGTPSFVDAVKNDYPAVFPVDHSGVDPYRPSEGPTHGEGEVTDMYTFVRDEISSATEAYRVGSFFSANPYPIVVPGTITLSTALIAVQKVDVVVHSYGGILTRWYVEQSPEYAERRDVRKIIELGTPNLGSPLANMVDQIDDGTLDRTIANATAHGVLGFEQKPMTDLMGMVNNGPLPNLMPTPAGTPTAPRPFYEDDSVNSARLIALNSNPFNSDIGYASIIGTKRTTPVSLAGPFVAPVDLYQVMQPEFDGVSYFPWIYQFDNAPSGTINGGTDGVVPTWSAALGVTAYNKYILTDHIDLVQNPDVQSQALQWLNDPNVPLGSTQRAAWSPQPPVSERNAYVGATKIDPTTGRLTGGGLNPLALIGVSFPQTGMGSAIWDASTGAGVHYATLTGMIRRGDIGNVSFGVSGLPDDKAHFGVEPSLLDNFKISLGPSNIPPAALQGANPSDWVPFTISLGKLGRRYDPILTGPKGQTQPSPFQFVTYQMADLPGGSSPPTVVQLPHYSLPAPSASGMLVTLSGSVESENSLALSQTTRVLLKASRPIFDDNLWINDLSVSHPGGIWDGLLIPYSSAVTLRYIDDDGKTAIGGPNGYTDGTSADLYQYIPSAFIGGDKSPSTHFTGN